MSISIAEIPAVGRGLAFQGLSFGQGALERGARSIQKASVLLANAAAKIKPSSAAMEDDDGGGPEPDPNPSPDAAVDEKETDA